MWLFSLIMKNMTKNLLLSLVFTQTVACTAFRDNAYSEEDRIEYAGICVDIGTSALKRDDLEKAAAFCRGAWDALNNSSTFSKAGESQAFELQRQARDCLMDALGETDTRSMNYLM